MTDAGRALVQLRADLKVFVRNPAALFFTAILPVIFLTLFISIFGNASAGQEYGNVRVSTLQVPAFIALAVVSASFVGLAMGSRRASARTASSSASAPRRCRPGSSSPAGSGPRS